MGLQAPWQSLAFVEMPTLERSGERQADVPVGRRDPGPKPRSLLLGNLERWDFPREKKSLASWVEVWMPSGEADDLAGKERLTSLGVRGRR